MNGVYNEATDRTSPRAVDHPYWGLTAEQAAVVSRAVRNQDVADLGAGDGSLSLRLLELGARRVTAIEHWPPGPLSEAVKLEQIAGRLQWMQSRFAVVQRVVQDVCVVSWPGMSPVGLVSLAPPASATAHHLPG